MKTELCVVHNVMYTTYKQTNISFYTPLLSVELDSIHSELLIEMCCSCYIDSGFYVLLCVMEPFLLMDETQSNE